MSTKARYSARLNNQVGDYLAPPPSPPPPQSVNETPISISSSTSIPSSPPISATRTRAVSFLNSITDSVPDQNVIFFKDSVFVQTPLSLGSRYYKGFFHAVCSITSNSFTFFAADHGAYPWGRSSLKGALAFLCRSLSIDTKSGVFNCCLFTHFLVAILELGLKSTNKLLLSHEALLREFLFSKRMRDDDVVMNFALKNLNLANKVCILFIAEFDCVFCISPQIFGSNSALQLFSLTLRNISFLLKLMTVHCPRSTSFLLRCPLVYLFTLL